MKICENGVIREMTEAEITNVAILAQEEALKPTSQELTRDEKVDLILAAIPTNAPEGTTGTDLPFKLGYKWKPAYNGNAFAWELVPDPRRNRYGRQSYYLGCRRKTDSERVLSLPERTICLHGSGREICR